MAKVMSFRGHNQIARGTKYLQKYSNYIFWRRFKAAMRQISKEERAFVVEIFFRKKKLHSSLQFSGTTLQKENPTKRYKMPFTWAKSE